MPIRRQMLFPRIAARFAFGMIIVLATLASAGADAVPLWLRDAAISPDGSHIAFRFRGQIWVVPAAGGDALSITPAGVHSSDPIWSPDASTIAFASDRFGPMNIFAASSSGGEAKRLTWYSLNEKPTAFTPDGKSVLFTSRRLGDVRSTFAYPGRSGEFAEQLYAVPAQGGREIMVLPNAALEARWDGAQQHLLYTAPSVEQSFRRGQTSTAARQVWTFDAATGKHERLTQERTESRNAVWDSSGGVVYLSEASGQLNVWRLSHLNGKNVQLTFFEKDPVRSLSISAGGDLAFAVSGEIYLLRSGSNSPERVNVKISQSWFPAERSDRTSEISEFVLSPNEREAALVARGDIFVGSLDGKYARRITFGPGESRDPSFSPDGRRIYFSTERNGRWALSTVASIDTEEKALSQSTRFDERTIKGGDFDAMSPRISPDGKKIAYVLNRESVHVVGVDGGNDVEVLSKGRDYAYRDEFWHFSWSPDSKWVSVPTQPVQSLTNVATVPADGSKPATQLSPSGEGQYGPVWSGDGGMILYAVNPQGLRGSGADGLGGEIDGAFVSRKARDSFRGKLRESVPPEGAPASVSDLPEGASNERDAASSEPTKNTKSKEREIFAFEPEGVEDRNIRLTQNPALIEYYALLNDGVSFLLVERTVSAQGDGTTATGSIRDLRTDRKRTIFSGLPIQRDAGVELSKDQKRLYFLQRSSEGGADGITEVDVAKGTNRSIRFSLDVGRDESATRHAAFDQFWELTKRKFYDVSLSGLDWEATRIKYAYFLPSLADARDLAELLSEMSGELKSSHTGGSYGGGVPIGEQTAALGLYFDEHFPGPGMKVSEILKQGPFDAADSAIAPGDVIVELDGKPIEAAGGIRRALRGKLGSPIAVTIMHTSGARFTEKRWPISLGREFELARLRWDLRSRDRVSEKTCGKIGYVHVPAMDAASYRSVFADILGRHINADGLIVDVRFNGGGNLHNQLLTLLTGKRYLEFAPPRGGPLGWEPRDRWTKPTAVIMNAASYSDASAFPHAYRDLKVGHLVGDAVAGTGTYVWWVASNLIPGLTYGLPQLPIRDLAGRLYENEDVQPDVSVPSNPTAWDRGEDPQLDAAIDALTQGFQCTPKAN